LGREVVVKTSVGDHKATYRGTLTDACDDTFSVEADEGVTEVSYDDVISAKTVFRWEKAPKPGH
jgi:ribosome maturation factor RimP